MNTITIQKIGITDLDTDAIVNAANDGLHAGSGVCGAIFEAAGYEEMTGACRAIGHCDTGDAVITPGFALRARYVIHAVGPVWRGGTAGEPQQLYRCYQRSMTLAVEHDCHSIGFPLISAGIFGYPKEKAWHEALRACRDFHKAHPNGSLAVTFAVLNGEILRLGKEILAEYPE